MIKRKERYVVDAQGRRIDVILNVKDYYKMLDELEELESIRTFDLAKASREEAIPIEQALAEIEQRGREFEL